VIEAGPGQRRQGARHVSAIQQLRNRCDRHRYWQELVSRRGTRSAWSGEWVRDANGEAVDHCCHYILAGGIIHFCGDCTHPLAGKQVVLPPLREFMCDMTNNGADT
jgi:hypothetical protein